VSAITLITGGTGKLGQVFVSDCLSRGDTAIVIGPREETLSSVIAAHPEAVRSSQLVTFKCDLMAPGAAASVVKFCRERALFPDGLINNARNLSFLRIGEDGLVDRTNFVAEFTLDVVVPYELSMALTTMPNSRIRRIVNIGSQYGCVAPNRALYNDFDRESPIQYGVAKAALIQLSRELAVRLAPRNVQVNCVSFGGVKGRANSEFEARYAKLVPMGRMLDEKDLAGPVAFLLSDASTGMTGHNLVVDGGWAVW
jgi:NAD(P)-dependent dehydrogenase (short-subunit alcohol dehydrogenase family)